MHPFANWPIIQQAVEQGILEFIDPIIARRILQKEDAESQSAAVALCHLSLLLRSGHLCMQIKPLHPDPNPFWAEMAAAILPLLEEGIAQLMQDLPQFLVLEGDTLYFQRFWNEESHCVKWVKEHESFRPLDQLSQTKFNERLKLHSNLLPHQSEAIKKALYHTITLITGGPGTGKTHTAGCLLDTLWSSLEPEKKENFKIALAAPTGKAASHLLQSISSKLNGPELCITASTLHSLLNLSPYSRGEELRLSHDLILVDECSMIDISLMVSLLKALKPGARLILLGDHRQLPPVEPGAPFADLIHYRSVQSDVTLKPAFLTECMRADLKEIVQFADKVNSGDVEGVVRMLEDNVRPVQSRLLPPVHQFQKTIDALADMFPPLACFNEYPDMQDLKAFRVLSPLKKGLWGVDSLNQALHKILLGRVPRGQKAAIPILLTSNDHQLKLYNGEVGFLVKDKAFFPTPEKSWRSVPAAILPRYQYGYCLSVHKSQGSEFDKIVVMLPQGAETLGRAVLYTAVTRAKSALEVWYDDKALRETLKQEQPRHSRLADRLASL